MESDIHIYEYFFFLYIKKIKPYYSFIDFYNIYMNFEVI